MLKQALNLKKIDWILLVSYIGINLLLFLSYVYNLINREFLTEYYFVLPFIFVFLIFDIYHKRFWNIKVLGIWSVIGIFQLVFYYYFKDLPELQAVNGNHITWLKAMPITLATMFIFNTINKRIYGDNFIVTMLRFDSKVVNPEDGRKLRPMDYMFSFCGFLIILFLTVFTV